MTTPAVSAWAGCPTCYGTGVLWGKPVDSVYPPDIPCPTCAAHNAAVAAAVEAEREAIAKMIDGSEASCRASADAAKGNEHYSREDRYDAKACLAKELAAAIRARGKGA